VRRRIRKPEVHRILEVEFELFDPPQPELTRTALRRFGQQVEAALDEHDIVVRGGTLSAQPVMESLGVPEGARAGLDFVLQHTRRYRRLHTRA
jgi:hypothetical protein